jgi:hypothetical protein
MRNRTDYETEYINHKWVVALDIFYLQFLKKLKNNDIAVSRINTKEYSFMTVKVNSKSPYIDEIIDLIMELSYEPKIVAEYRLREYYYINVRFNIES